MAKESRLHKRLLLAVACASLDARDPKRKVALKIENKRRFSGHEDWWSTSHLCLSCQLGEHRELQEDEPDAKQGKDTIPLRKYEAGGRKLQLLSLYSVFFPDRTGAPGVRRKWLGESEHSRHFAPRWPVVSAQLCLSLPAVQLRKIQSQCEMLNESGGAAILALQMTCVAQVWKFLRCVSHTWH